MMYKNETEQTKQRGHSDLNHEIHRVVGPINHTLNLKSQSNQPCEYAFRVIYIFMFDSSQQIPLSTNRFQTVSWTL